jgi:hypothetical protein
MRQPRTASKSVKLQRPDEGRRVQSLLASEDMAADDHSGRILAAIRERNRGKCVPPKIRWRTVPGSRANPLREFVLQSGGSPTAVHHERSDDKDLMTTHHDETTPDTKRFTADEIFRAAVENARGELRRSVNKLAFSGIAGGLTMGLSAWESLPLALCSAGKVGTPFLLIWRIQSALLR